MEKPVLTKDERKEKRAARRQKQREKNVLRASKMHNLRLKAQPRASSISKNQKTIQCNIGCSGWFYWHWRNLFYTADLPAKDWFAYYSSKFKTVEINASFYSWPTEATVKSWIKHAGRKKFLYTVKVCELITHIKKFTGTQQLVKDFSYIADILGNRMGCFLYQLPPSYSYTPARLRSIISQMPKNQTNVVEFRHASWWNENVYKEFKKEGIVFCSCSAPRLPDELIKTSDHIYIRFHGKKSWYRHNYTKEELDVWAQRVKKSKAKTVWIYFNNDFDGYAPKNARMFERMLK